MDISLREWLIIIGVLIILGVIIDGLRRMRLGRKDQLQMSRRLGGDLNDVSPLDDIENPELPTRGFRVIRRGEDSVKYAEAARAFEADQARDHSKRVEPGFDEDTDLETAEGRDQDPPSPSARPTLDKRVEKEALAVPAYASEDVEEDGHGRGVDHTEDDEVSADDRYDEAVADAHEPLMSEVDDTFAVPGRRDAEEQPMHAEDDEDDRVSRASGSGRKTSAKAGVATPAGKAAAPRDEGGFKERFLQKMGPVRRMTEKVQSISRAKPQPPAKPTSKMQHLTVVNVVSRDEKGFDGATLDRILKAVGMQRTPQDTFVRHEDDFDEGEVQFTLVNAVEPGTFPHDMISFRTPCLALILVLPGPDNTIQAFDYMIEIAQVIVKNCNGELLDSDHSAMTSQTIEHHRQTIREFERKSRSVRV